MDWNHVGGNTVNGLVTNVISMADTLGKAALHAIAPDNFEYYSCSLELLDGSKSSNGFMTFAVMPNNMMETKTQIATITKTNSGIVTNFNSTFIPRDISIQGTFGRKLRIILGNKEPAGDEKKDTWYNTLGGGNLGFNIMDGEAMVKTGYGLTKFLKKMIDKAYTLDENGMPYVLIWTNYAFNTSYVVEILQSSFSQSLDNNMLWYYNLEMKAIAPSSSIKTENVKTYLTRVASNSIANSINDTLSNVANSLMQF